MERLDQYNQSALTIPVNILDVVVCIGVAAERSRLYSTPFPMLKRQIIHCLLSGLRCDPRAYAFFIDQRFFTAKTRRHKDFLFLL